MIIQLSVVDVLRDIRAWYIAIVAKTLLREIIGLKESGDANPGETRVKRIRRGRVTLSKRVPAWHAASAISGDTPYVPDEVGYHCAAQVCGAVLLFVGVHAVPQPGELTNFTWPSQKAKLPPPV